MTNRPDETAPKETEVSGEILAKTAQQVAQQSRTLFGRTMAGKSTLMEILTRGDGRSIGKGGQRTTQDAREYEWNGMKVLDIPGVAAMDGALDEETAYGAAHQADLILLLITDDAPQQVEAEHLARLWQIGVPILGICNVKRAVDDDPLAQTNPRRPAGQVMRHHLARQPGALGGEAPRRHVVQPDAVLEVAYGVLDLGVAAMIGLQFQRLPIAVGDEGVIAVSGEEGELGTGRRLHPPDNEPHRRGVRLGLERSVEPVSKVSNSASVYTVSRRWERRQEYAASRYGPGADVAVAAVS